MSVTEPVPTTTTTIAAGLSSIFQQSLNISATSAEILVSVIIFGVIGIIGSILYAAINKYVARLTRKTTTKLTKDIGSVIKISTLILIGILSIQFSLSPLSFLDPYSHVLDVVFLIMQGMFAAYAISKIINVIIDSIAERTENTNNKNYKHTLFILKQATTAIIFVITVLILLNLLGLTGALQTVVASATVGGIVIAFALQSILSDLFSSFTLYISRPFELGDFIYVGEHGGTVTNIGILTTRLQLIQGEELVVPNKELTSKDVRNFRKLQKRRIVFYVGVTYDTPNEKLKKIPSMIIDIINNVKTATPQFVNFQEFGDFSLKFFISYFVHAPDYGSYLAVQEQINLAIREAFERDGIEMAYLKNALFIKK
jgi:small-conductance mechanosensitive channel